MTTPDPHPPKPSPLSLLPSAVSPLDDAWVSLDLETTGLSAANDHIIEIGAVRFRGAETLDTFQTFVNPHTRLGNFIRRYTGITQEEVDGAPSFSRAGGELAAFIGQAPVVAHNVAFDTGFLTAKGLRLMNPRADTWDLAFVLLPRSREYSLAGLAASMGISHPRPHRALDDALAARDLFLRLAGMARELDVNTVAEMERLASRSTWGLSYFLRAL